jgi:cyclopropane fatty-acyl-phospholipid synthase-like methyltransferase
MIVTTPSWDASYTADTAAPWDIGRPQPVFVGLAEEGRLSGRVLDAGCGTGEQVLLAAEHGARAPMGIDISPTAIGRARAKAADRGLSARFEVGDALDLGTIGQQFDTLLDSGLLHVFSDQDRVRYVTSLAAALQPGGYLFLMCFSDREPGDVGPRRLREDELRSAFSAGWAVESITPEVFEVNHEFFPAGIARAWLAVVRRA